MQLLVAVVAAIGCHQWCTVRSIQTHPHLGARPPEGEHAMQHQRTQLGGQALKPAAAHSPRQDAELQALQAREPAPQREQLLVREAIRVSCAQRGAARAHGKVGGWG